MNLISFLYKLARTANDIKTFSSGDPKKISQRIKNKFIGRKIVSRLFKFPY